jgi:hypothetical protein
MKSLSSIAESAYVAHGKEMARSGVPGAALRPWGEIEPSERHCWEQVARQVLAEAATAGMDLGGLAPDIHPESIQHEVPHG